MFKRGNTYFCVATTRFNNETLMENQRYVENCLDSPWKCIYGFPIKINSKNIPFKLDVFVLEMNNDMNQIAGIGKIQNYLYCEEPLYIDRSYNQYIYKGKRHVSRETLIENNSKGYLESIEKKLFKGSGHLKRGFGITRVPQNRLSSDEVDYIYTMSLVLNS